MIQAVIQILINTTSVQQAVGKTGDNAKYKIFPVIADGEEALPYTVASIIGNNPNYCKDGASRLDTVSFQTITYAKFYEDMDAIDTAQRFALDGFNGISAAIPLNIWITNQQDLWDDARQAYARVSDYNAHVTRKL